MKKIYTLLSVLLCTTLAFAQESNNYSKGVFIVNEDWYGHQNSTVNFLSDEGEWTYRVVQKENPGKELGCTNQYGQIYGDRFYFVAKQEKDPGADVTGGRFTVCDAKTMKIICQLPFIAEKDGKSIADGRSCLGVDENKVYIGTTNGIYIFNTKSLQVTGKVEGISDNTSLYTGQVGSMVRVDDYVFAVHQSEGVLVIDPSTDKVAKVIDFTAIIDKFNAYLALSRLEHCHVERRQHMGAGSRRQRRFGSNTAVPRKN